MTNKILKVTVENFLSFNARQTVDFTKSNIGCLIGHNGSGKTNLLLAIDRMAECFLNLNNERMEDYPSFDQQKKPTLLEIEFAANSKKMKYVFESISENDTIIKEELRNSNNKLILDMELHSDVGQLSEIEKERILT